jgi:sugar/nucleoside kinase (ribokinase family)
MGPEHLDEQSIAQATWLLLEGYFLTASEQNEKALYQAITLAQKHGTKVAFTLSAEFVISAKHHAIAQKILPAIDLLFANKGEALLLTSTSDTNSALNQLATTSRSVVITQGEKGSLGIHEGMRWSIDASKPPGPVIDTTGAGDVFAGAYLAGLMQGHSPDISARQAANLAALIVTQYGAHLPSTISTTAHT